MKSAARTSAWTWLATASILPAQLLLTGINACETTTDADADGWTAEDGDCNDQNAEIYPGAAELCDGIDDDCNGIIEENQYDEDNDGIADCLQQSDADGDGFTPAQGDCEEGDPSVYPGADDSPGDAIDSDCGGKDSPQPHVGLSDGSIASIQAALNAAQEGDTVWVGPGSYLEHNLDMLGKALTLASTHGASSTIVDARAQGPIMRFTRQEASDSVVRGFTLQNGAANDGAGILVSLASPTLERLIIRDCEAGDSGGGMYLSNSQVILRHCRFENNRGYAGGGIFSDESSPTIMDTVFNGNFATGYLASGGGLLLVGGGGTVSGCSFTANVATYGAGMAARSSSARTDGSTFTDNLAYSDGGGVYIEGGAPNLMSCSFSGNEAGSGGGAEVWEATPTFSDCSFVGNHASYGGGLDLYSADARLERLTIAGHHVDRGGAIMMTDSSPSITGSRFIDNQADRTGAAIDMNGSSPVITDTVFNNNRAQDVGGAIYGLLGGTASITNVTIAGNVADYGGGIYLQDGTGSLIRNSIISHNTGYNIFVSGATATISYSDLFSPQGPSHNLSSLPSSNLTVDPGFIAISGNRDSSDDDFHLQPGSLLRDVGDPALSDVDGSRSDMGAYAGPGANRDYYADADGDGLFDGWEHRHALDSNIADGSGDPDGDGSSNLEELASSTSPQVADSDSDGVTDGAELNADSDPANWYSQPLIPIATASVPGDFSSLQAAIDAIRGEGVIELGAGTFDVNLVIDARIATVRGTGPASTVLRGQLPSGGGNAGSVVGARWSRVSLRGMTITGGNSESGGGLYFVGTGGTLEDLWIVHNVAGYYGYGGGVYLAESSPTIRSCVIGENSCEGRLGGGMKLLYSSPSILNTRIENNDVHEDGGGVELRYSSPTFTSSAITGNSAPRGYGGAMNAGPGSNLTLKNCVVTGNSAAFIGGLYAWDSSSRVNISSTIAAFNSPYNLVLEATIPGEVIRYSDFYSSNSSNVSGTSLDNTNIQSEPGFLSYAGGVPADLHLATGSPVVNRGDTAVLDTDGTRADMGIYGGPSGDEFDLDVDGYPDYFWPGGISTPPSGFSASSFDRDDRDPSYH